jgi:hypothetical protein
MFWRTPTWCGPWTHLPPLASVGTFNHSQDEHPGGRHTLLLLRSTVKISDQLGSILAGGHVRPSIRLLDSHCYSQGGP